MNACVHTYTKPQTSSTRSRGSGWRIHGSVEDTKLSTNKQHSLSEAMQLLKEYVELAVRVGRNMCGAQGNRRGNGDADLQSLPRYALLQR